MTTDHRCPVCGGDNGPDTGGCRCYGTPDPYYPSSADLAAFRRSIIDLSAYARAMRGAYGWASTPRALDHPAAGGAWADERRDGIGYRYDPEHHATAALLGATVEDGIDARREASALRSRAFALWTRLPHGRDRATLDELAHGAPVWPRYW